MLAVHHAADFLVLSFFIYVGLVCLLGLVVRLRFPPGDRQSMKPVCGLSHGQSVH